MAKAIRKGIVEECENDCLLSVNTDKVFPITPMAIIVVNKTNLQIIQKCTYIFIFQVKTEIM